MKKHRKVAEKMEATNIKQKQGVQWLTGNSMEESRIPNLNRSAWDKQ